MLEFVIDQLIYTVFNYYSILMAFYWYHRFIHQSESGILYRLHYIGHHKTAFPIRKLRALEYSKTKYDRFFKTAGELVFGIPVIALSTIVYYTTTIEYFVNFVVVTCLVAISGEMCHS